MKRCVLFLLVGAGIFLLGLAAVIKAPQLKPYDLGCEYPPPVFVTALQRSVTLSELEAYQASVVDYYVKCPDNLKK